MSEKNENFLRLESGGDGSDENDAAHHLDYCGLCCYWGQWG